MVDVNIIDDPLEVAWCYIKGPFLTDAIAVVPYYMIDRNYIFIRLLKASRYRLYQSYVSTAITDAAFDLIDNTLVKRIVDTFNMGILLLLLAHFFACIWILIG